MKRFAVILPAAGRSSRFGGPEKKPFAALDGRAVWLRSAELFLTRPDVCQCLLVIGPDDRDLFNRRFGANVIFLDVQVVEGGPERFDSVANALAQLRPDAEYVAVHDAVRPGLPPALIDAVFAEAVAHGAALLAVPVTDTVKQVGPDGMVRTTLPRENLWLAQTPQVSRRDWLEQAYAARDRLKEPVTDDAQLLEAAGHPVRIVEGSAANLKITTPEDLELAVAILRARGASAAPEAEPRRPFEDEDMWGGR